MITSKKLVAALTLTLCLLFSGCNTAQTAHHQPSTHNFLGIIKVEDSSYSVTGPNTFELKGEDIMTQNDYTGNKTTLFWGLITISD